jgi:hypothetical protein
MVKIHLNTQTGLNPTGSKKGTLKKQNSVQSISTNKKQK